MYLIVFGMWRVDYDPFFALIALIVCVGVLEAVVAL